MKKYEIMEHRNCDERYNWGIYLNKENGRLYLKYVRWDDNGDFEIIEHEVDEKLKYILHKKGC